MDREQAKNLIRKTFENPFDKDRFCYFLRNLLKSFDDSKTFIYIGNYIPDAFEKSINSLERIGQYTYDDKEIDLLIVQLKKTTSLERARTMQRNFIAWYLKGSRGGKLKDGALVAFITSDSDDWRFSLVKMDYRFEETPTGKYKIKEEFTPAKRWSFLVGKNENSHTAQSRFLPILENDNFEPTLDNLEELFNVEVVTKEFFEKYRDLFIRTKLELDKIVHNDPKVRKEFENKNINTVDFAKKLLGQIIFLYFLQKKGWFGVEKGKPWGTGPKDFIRRLFNKEFKGYTNFFNDILEPLFYEALRTDRGFNDHYYDHFNCKIPFLNGGLFDPINDYDWINTDIVIPDELFSNTNRTKEGDIGDGILDVFDRYNFTVNEEEPLEKEVALDPELLGKIYEKLNAIRPDNFDEYVSVLQSGKKGEETKFNKEYGVYYTPRQIVHYMCKESLLNYLETELQGNVSRKDLEKFFEYAETLQEYEAVAIEKEKKIKTGEQKSTKYESQIPETIKQYAKEIDNLLADIKVCDPAVGSGAFPIGMLHEIVKLRQLLSIYLNRDVNSYNLKRQCIENSLYGVDIDPGAIETCKLRFWLSLIVDEEDFYQIKPLPNLDFKIVCGDSLLGFPENWTSAISEQIEVLMDEYFSETNPDEKQKIKNKIDEKIKSRLENSERNFGYKINFDFRLFFLRVFREKGGFDIVIENPPYVRQEKIKHYKQLLQNVKYEVFNSTSDLYTYFYEKSYKIAKDKGTICMITSNKWMRAKYGEKLRKILKDKTEIKQIIDFGGYQVFEATVDTNIILFQKAKPADGFINVLNVEKDFLEASSLDEYFRIKGFRLKQSELNPTCFTLSEDRILRLKEKIEKIGIPLKDWDVKIYFGIKTGFNEAFIIDSKKRQEILDNCKDEVERKRTEEIIKPILRGRDIGKYYYKWAGLWMIKIESGWTNRNCGRINPEEFFKTQYPTIYNHLISFKNCRGKGKGLFNRDDQGDYWWELRVCDYYSEFEKEKIVWQEMSDDPSFCIEADRYYTNQTVYIMTGDNLKFLCAILNSKVSNFYMKNLSYSLSEQVKRWIKQYVELIPIPPITPQNKLLVEKIEFLVNQIIYLIQSADYLSNLQKQEKVKELEKQIDQLVYKLYDLTEEEIRIVEGNN